MCLYTLQFAIVISIRLNWDLISPVNLKGILLIDSVTKLPIVLKGVLTSEDALLGVKFGADAIMVSNHGARQIDGTPASVISIKYMIPLLTISFQCNHWNYIFIDIVDRSVAGNR
jgi:hypothetical protein